MNGPRERIAKGETSDYRTVPVPPEQDQTFRHGTLWAYTKHGCRCERCLAARRRKDRRRRANAKRRFQRDGAAASLRHGSVHAYKLGCRCPECIADNSERLRVWRSANPGADAASMRQGQRETLPTATRYGQQWTGADLEIVVTRTDLPLVQLAKMLGRSRIAVASARQKAKSDPKWRKVAGVDDA